VWIQRSRRAQPFPPAVWPLWAPPIPALRCSRPASGPAVRRNPQAALLVTAVWAPARSIDLQVVMRRLKPDDLLGPRQPKSNRHNRPDQQAGTPRWRSWCRARQADGGAQPGGCATAPKQCDCTQSRFSTERNGAPAPSDSSGGSAPCRERLLRVRATIADLDKRLRPWIHAIWPSLTTLRLTSGKRATHEDGFGSQSDPSQTAPVPWGRSAASVGHSSPIQRMKRLKTATKRASRVLQSSVERLSEAYQFVPTLS